MKTIESISFNPVLNLAWEEYILKHIHKDEDIFLLWQNHTSITLGRNQNIYEEVVLSYVHEHQIPVVRRISGGGCVFHDLGNVNFSYITKNKNKISNYELMTKDIIKILNELAIPAEFVPKSDIKINGRKISGNAQYIYQDKLLHHGTLLFNSDLSFLQKALKTPTLSTQSLSVKSNRSKVTNIANYTNLSLDDLLLEIKTRLNLEPMMLSTEDLNKIHDLAFTKYQTEAWNYGESPQSKIIKKENGYDIVITIVKGFIETCEILYHNEPVTSLNSSLPTMFFSPSNLYFLKTVDPILFQILFD